MAINRELYLGLFDWEGHLAVYPEGAFYRRHLDRFQHDGRRTVSTVLYLNEHWQPGDGGELRVWSGPDADSAFVDVAPLSGRLVIFLSGEVYHGVQPSSFERISVTGWFRTRSEKLN
jgi:SM-20-related protein